MPESYAAAQDEPVPEENLSEGLFELSEIASPEPETRRGMPSTWGGVFFLALLGLAGAGLWFAAGEDTWRVGVLAIGVCLLLSAGLRVVLPHSHAGMLAVRHWLLDATLLATVGVIVIVLALSINNRPVG